MTATTFTHKRVTILGLGRYPQGSSIASAEFMVRHGAIVTVVDEKPARELHALPMWKKRLPQVRYKLGEFQEEDITGADCIVRNPSILPHHHLLRKAAEKGIPVYTDISLFFSLRRRVDVGITGTRGKSTTAALVAHIAKQHSTSVHLGGNIATSPLSFAENLKQKGKIILELSSYLTESLTPVRRSPHIACITNIYPDHLNVHRNFHEYREAKANIFRYQTRKDFCILNADEPHANSLARRVRSQLIWFSGGLLKRNRGVFVEDENVVYKHDGKRQCILALSDIHIPGNHNIANVCAAVAVSLALRIPISKIRVGVRTFHGLPHRLEYIGKKRGFAFYNDSASTIPEATIRALETMREPVILLVGGNDKKLQYSSLFAGTGDRVRHAFLLPGTATPKIEAACKRFSISCTRARSLRDAFRQAVAASASGTVLLSPAASSFSEFQNEFERGEAFRSLVNAL